MYNVYSLCLLFLGALHIQTSGAWTLSNYTRTKRQDCGFRCKNSECINEDYECDGKVDCQDGSDETDDCKNFKCQSFLFTCDYGACINKALVCNGKKDCRDNSDEKGPTCGANTTHGCKMNEFHCDSGECLNEDLKCDGKADCRDGSDETEKTCSDMICPGYTYRCRYGACVKYDAKCNGFKECIDGSDEDHPECNDKPEPVPHPPTKVTTEPPDRGQPPYEEIGSCVLPPYPTNGRWKVLVLDNNMYSYKPGHKVSVASVIQVLCDEHYAINAQSALVICFSGRWSSQLPQCVRKCPSFYSTDTTKVSCTFNNRDINCTDAIEGTEARFFCAQHYEDLQLIRNNIRYCGPDGLWDFGAPNCMPVCGQKTAVPKTLVVGGMNVTKGHYPWQVALYKKNSAGQFLHRCGGSLISQRIIVTAAHCVSRSAAEVMDKDIFMVAVGKYFREYDVEDEDAQFSQVSNIFVSEKYDGIDNQYEGDFAVLIAKTSFNFSEYILPVCIDLAESIYYETDLGGTFGVVTGWGLTTPGGNQSDVLKEISVPYVPPQRCRQEIDIDYKRYILSDKMCAGYLNKGIGVCEGDSGGGLAFVNERDFFKRYYLRGIVSISPQEKSSCNVNQYALYTRVSHYIHIIKEKLRAFQG